ncbi:MAG: hypothetical protein PHG63_01190 [Candidatus Dojkabacteria bacterium]|nr:hypothetical protein [Candidatus Dojkabacteria bacterium]
MKSSNLTKIKEYLQSRLFKPSLFEVDGLLKHIQTKRELRILYGETYDLFGLTIDSIKNYFLLEYLTRLLKEEDISVEAVLLIGDVASIRNINVDDKNAVLKQIERNLKIINKIVNKYHLSFKVKKMSSIFKTQQFITNFQKVQQFYEQSNVMKDLLEETVLKNRVKQELAVGFKYSLEEVAIISNFDLKIGPPREIKYDKASQIFTGQKPLGIYVNPTYPLGFNYDYFINHPEIDEFGVTPYKAGSNRLQANRIILGQTSREQIKELITKSFIPKFEDLPNPINDIYQISVLSKAVREGKTLSLRRDTVLSKDIIYNLFIDEFNEYFK